MYANGKQKKNVKFIKKKLYLVCLFEALQFLSIQLHIFLYNTSCVKREKFKNNFWLVGKAKFFFQILKNFYLLENAF